MHYVLLGGAIGAALIGGLFYLAVRSENPDDPLARFLLTYRLGTAAGIAIGAAAGSLLGWLFDRMQSREDADAEAVSKTLNLDHYASTPKNLAEPIQAALRCIGSVFREPAPLFESAPLADWSKGSSNWMIGDVDGTLVAIFERQEQTHVLFPECLARSSDLKVVRPMGLMDFMNQGGVARYPFQPLVVLCVVFFRFLRRNLVRPGDEDWFFSCYSASMLIRGKEVSASRQVARAALGDPLIQQLAREETWILASIGGHLLLTRGYCASRDRPELLSATLQIRQLLVENSERRAE